ncbi:hypothetical protein GCM10010977_29770 [Citricoccus zhacaiensis]|uniref:Uncharacterized protein n=2 Tax=Citricoccus TaxID=169133 RepID=A0ABV6F1N9_9MICC|nr:MULTISPECIES: hypothetical protein [Citricoccus]GGO48960.1 hypothetical protein GCM10010977_29770 [Citricoccus zhacaiensis]VXC13759.1 hypothetical protein CITRIK5_70823 [Citricoccus sp. K5]
MRAWLSRTRGGLRKQSAGGMAGHARRHGGPRRARAVRRVCALLAATGLAVVVAGCAGPGQGQPPEPVLGHGEQFSVGVFEPRAGRVGAPRAGTLVVHEGGCLALRHSPAAGGGTRVVAVPVGSSVSERGTVYVVAGDADRNDGPVMAGHVGAQVRFKGPEVVLGEVGGKGVFMPPGCRADGTRILLVKP